MVIIDGNRILIIVITFIHFDEYKDCPDVNDYEKGNCGTDTGNNQNNNDLKFNIITCLVLLTSNNALHRLT